MELDRIYNGDCLELMRAMPARSVDLVIMDPPYDITNIQPGENLPCASA